MNKDLFKTRKVLCLILAFVTILSLSISATGGDASGGAYDLGGDTYHIEGDTDAPSGAPLSVSAWEWVDDGGVVEVGNTVTLPDVGKDSPVGFDVLCAILPQSVTVEVNGERITLPVTWSCEEFPASAAGGMYTFTALLPAEYIFDEGVDAPVLTVRLGDPSTWIIDVEKEFENIIFVPDSTGTYRISSIEELNMFAELVKNGTANGSKAKITANITGTITMPIGTTNVPYAGTFDGQGYTLTLGYNFSSDSYTGLFGEVKGGTIQNINLVVDPDSYSNSATTGSGFLCGRLDSGSAYNCHVSFGGSSTAMSESSSAQSFGALIGVLSDEYAMFAYDTQVEQCSVNFGSMKLISSSKYFGGLIGQIRTSGYVLDSIKILRSTVETVDGNLYAGNPTVSVGGLVGVITGAQNAEFSSPVEISLCGFAGEILAIGSPYMGGLIGYIPNDTSSLRSTFTLDDLQLYECFSYCFDLDTDSSRGSVVGYHDNSLKDASGTGRYFSYYANTSHFRNIYTYSDVNSDPDGLLAENGCATACSNSRFTSGEVCYILNKSVTNGTQPFYQRIRIDAYPRIIAFSDSSLTKANGTVYTDCQGVYTNVSDPHKWTLDNGLSNNGFCVNCGKYQPATIDTDGTVLISNAGQLFWFAGHVGVGTSMCVDPQLGVVGSSSNARLTSDIIVNSGVYSNGTLDLSKAKHEWSVPASGDLSSDGYTGTFDGNNRYIAGLYVPDDSYSYVSGLFGVVSGTIKNLEVRTSYFGVKGETGAICAIAARNATISNCKVWSCGIATSSDSSNSFVGGLVGVMDGGRIENCTVKECTIGNGESHLYAGGIVGEVLTSYGQNPTIIGCINESSKVSSFIYAGGIVGSARGLGSDTLTIKDTYNTGAFAGHADNNSSSVGGIVGCWHDGSGTLISCFSLYSIPTYPNVAAHIGQLIGYYPSAGSTITLERCILPPSTLEGSGNATIVKVDSKIVNNLTTGEGAWVLNGGDTSSSAPYGQNIDTDPDLHPHNSHPHLMSEGWMHVVYAKVNCWGSATAATEFSNYPENVSSSGHSYDANGFCKNASVGGEVCGAYQPAVYNGAYDRYEISNAGMLYWFASLTSGTLAETCDDTTTPQDSAANGILTKDITDNADVNVADGRRDWIGIGGTLAAGYTGTFDGNGHFVSGLYMRRAGAVGLVCYGSGGMTVQNVTVKNSSFTTTEETDQTGGSMLHDVAAGAVVGRASATEGRILIENCHGNNNHAAWITKASWGVHGVGGIVGLAGGNGDPTTDSAGVLISGCTSTGGQVSAPDTGAGGIVGSIHYGVTIENCTNFTPVTGDRFAGGIVSYSTARGNMILHCCNNGAVTVNGYYAGGIIALGNNTTIENCYNTGAITSTGGSGSAYAIIGGSFNGQATTNTVRNCHNVGTLTGATALFCGATDGSKILNVSNSYTLGDATEGAAETYVTKSAAQFASGEVTWLLNENELADPKSAPPKTPMVWYQNVDNGETPDAYPVFEGGIVYHGYDHNCFAYENNNIDVGNNKNALKAAVFSNSPLLSYPHNYVNGFCVNEQDGVVCGKYEKAVLVTEDNYEDLGVTADHVGYYAAGNAGQLYWITAHIEGRAQNADCDDYGNSTYYGFNTIDVFDIDRAVTDTSGVVLTSSISVNNAANPASAQTWAPIGSHQQWYTYDVNSQDRENKYYSGVFDGRGHTISNLKVDTDEYGGLFAILSGTAKSFVLRDAVIASSATSTYHVGGVAAIANYDSSTDVLIEDVGLVNCDISSSSASVCAGGIIGYASSTVTVRHCYNEGTSVSGGGYAGGIIGRALPTSGYEALIEHCYNTGTINGSGATAAGGILGRAENSTVIIRSCHSVGTASGAASVGGIVGSKYNSAPMSYAYSTQSPLFASSGQADSGVDKNTTAVKTAEQFASGEVAYLLNSGVIDGTQVWYQDIDNEDTGATLDAYPVFSGGTVYGKTNCMSVAGAAEAYSNTPFPPTADMHNFNEYGFCTNKDSTGTVTCNAYEPATEVTAENYGALGVSADHVGYHAIANPGQLWWFACYVNGNSPDGGRSAMEFHHDTPGGVLTADIDMSKAPDGVNWIPIGGKVPDSESQNFRAGCRFGGSFDGGGHTIKNLTHTIEDDYVLSEFESYRFFGIIGTCGSYSDAVIKDLTIENFTVTTDALYAGLVCARMNCNTNIVNCHTVNSSIESTSTRDYTAVGGILGSLEQNDYYEYTEVYVERCSNSAQVTGSANAGGIAGYSRFTCDSLLYPNQPRFFIRDCANHGAIVGGENNYGRIASGGIIGDFYYGDLGDSAVTVVEDCYNRGTVNGSLPSGKAAFSSNSSCTVTNCYYLADTGAEGRSSTVLAKDADQFASGEVTWLLNSSVVDEQIVGVTDGSQAWYQDVDNNEMPYDLYPVHEPFGATLYYGYENCQASEMIYTNDEVSATKTHNFDNGFCTNEISDGVRCDMYESAVLVTAESREGLGFTDETYDGYYAIANAGQLYWMSEHVIGTAETGKSAVYDANVDNTDNFVLVDDIVINKSLSESVDGARTWVYDSAGMTWFSGTFDGNENSITGLYIDNAEDGYAGLFGMLMDATVKDLTMRECVINAPAGYYVAAITGNAMDSSIEGITVDEKCSVTGNSYVGGVAGLLASGCSITGCANDASVTGSGDHVGGIAGYAACDAVTRCSNGGNVTGGSNTGGIAGKLVGSSGNYAELTLCCNTGNVTGGSTVGGIVGDAQYFTVEDCYNTGALNSGLSCGGIAALCGGGEIKNCYNIGALGDSMFGGDIAGMVTGAVSITNCYSINNDEGSYTGVTLTNVEARTPEQFASGEVAWLLNEKQPAGADINGLDLVWRQDVDNADTGATLDPSPNFTDAVVYPIIGCMGSSTPADYTNDPGNAMSHNFENGFCTNTDGEGNVCDKYQSATLVTADNYGTFALDESYVGYYAIANAGQLYWAIEHISGEAETSGSCAVYDENVDEYGSFVLVDDITINEGLSQSTDGARQWVYDSDKDLWGMFDGANHSITGLYINTDSTYHNQGMFWTVWGTVKNLTMRESIVNAPNASDVGIISGFLEDENSLLENITVDEDCSVVGSRNIGGIVGFGSRGTITDCTNGAAVSASGTEEYPSGGGIVGYNCNPAITGCVNTGSVTVGDGWGGGIVGNSGGASIVSCHNEGRVSAVTAAGISGCHTYISSVETVISRCYNLGDIICPEGEFEYPTFAAGIVALNRDIVEDCYNLGSLSGEYVGGITVENSGLIRNCYNAGELTADYIGSIANYNYYDACSVENCYALPGPALVYDNTIGATITDVEQKTAEEFASGEIAWLLNEKRPADANDEVDELIWRQDIDNGEKPYDPSPNFTDDFVYPVESCMGGEDPAFYTNDPLNAFGPAHNFSTHGFCENTDGVTTCHAYQPAKTGDAMYVSYQIGNLGQLFWFAAHVNNADPTTDAHVDALTVNHTFVGSAPVTLTTDLDFTNVPDGIEWIPIGAFANSDNAVAKRPYLGTFDGGRHIVSNLEVSIGREAGFFGRVGNEQTQATIQNLGVVGTVHSTNDRAGVFAGELHHATVTNCFAAGTATTGGVGCQTGVFAGEAANATISNCHGYDSASKLGFLGEGGTAPASMVNCYYLAESGSTEGQSASTILPKTAEQFASGEVGWLLNNKRPTSGSDNIDILSLVWKQTLDSDLYPVFTGNPPIFDDGGGGGDVDYVQVEVSWTDMTFNYGRVWIPEEHVYLSEWGTSSQDAGALTIHNKGSALKVNVIIEKVLPIASSLDIYRGYRGLNTWMKNDDAANIVSGDTVALASGDKIMSSISIYGDPSAPLSDEAIEIASIKVSLLSN